MSDAHHGDPRVLATDLHVEATYRLTEALVASEKRMRRRIELLNEVVFETDSKGGLVFLNEAWRRVLGRVPEECLGHSLSEFVVADDLPLLSAALGGVGDSVPGLQPQFRMLRADSGVAWIELSVSPLADGGVVGALRDVTRERAARQEIAKLSLVASCTDNLVIITDNPGFAGVVDAPNPWSGPIDSKTVLESLSNGHVLLQKLQQAAPAWTYWMLHDREPVSELL
mgnify:CR=1 FL=1